MEGIMQRQYACKPFMIWMFCPQHQTRK